MLIQLFQDILRNPTSSVWQRTSEAGLGEGTVSKALRPKQCYIRSMGGASKPLPLESAFVSSLEGTPIFWASLLQSLSFTCFGDFHPAVSLSIALMKGFRRNPDKQLLADHFDLFVLLISSHPVSIKMNVRFQFSTPKLITNSIEAPYICNWIYKATIHKLKSKKTKKKLKVNYYWSKWKWRQSWK